MKYLLFIFLLLVPTASADIADVISLLSPDRQIMELDDMLYLESLYRPEQIHSSAGHILFEGDILGYRDMVRYNGTDYINNGTPDVIYVYSVDHDIKGKRWFNYNIDYLRHTPTVEFNDTYVIITIDVDFKYHKSTLKHLPNGRKKIKKTFYSEQHIFKLIEPLPVQFPPAQNMTINFMYYNNSIQPKTMSRVPDLGQFQKIEYRYKNESLVYRNYCFFVEYLDTGVPIANITPLNRFDSNQNKAILSLHETVWIPDTFNESALAVTVYDPYGGYPVYTNVSEETELQKEIPWITIISIIMPLFFIAKVIYIFIA